MDRRARPGRPHPCECRRDLAREPGIGKTSLLEHALRQAKGSRVLRMRLLERESGLPFAPGRPRPTMDVRRWHRVRPRVWLPERCDRLQLSRRSDCAMGASGGLSAPSSVSFRQLPGALSTTGSPRSIKGTEGLAGSGTAPGIGRGSARTWRGGPSSSASWLNRLTRTEMSFSSGRLSGWRRIFGQALVGIAEGAAEIVARAQMALRATSVREGEAAT
jgi:hypothetical protein